jgi:hypothetical protein
LEQLVPMEDTMEHYKFLHRNIDSKLAREIFNGVNECAIIVRTTSRDPNCITITRWKPDLNEKQAENRVKIQRMDETLQYEIKVALIGRLVYSSMDALLFSNYTNFKVLDLNGQWRELHSSVSSSGDDSYFTPAEVNF